MTRSFEAVEIVEINRYIQLEDFNQTDKRLSRYKELEKRKEII